MRVVRPPSNPSKRLPSAGSDRSSSLVDSARTLLPGSLLESLKFAFSLVYSCPARYILRRLSCNDVPRHNLLLVPAETSLPRRPQAATHVKKPPSLAASKPQYPGEDSTRTSATPNLSPLHCRVGPLTSALSSSPSRVALLQGRVRYHRKPMLFVYTAARAFIGSHSEVSGFAPTRISTTHLLAVACIAAATSALHAYRVPLQPDPDDLLSVLDIPEPLPTLIPGTPPILSPFAPPVAVQITNTDSDFALSLFTLVAPTM
ncbi:hypothetical protein C8F01DRAFT_1258309 [Mycena amicta]|nr:hypothetical protein C8F01DRAFT_1258309 [Mycena amicta]